MYKIIYEKRVLKDLKRIDKANARFLIYSLQEFSSNFNKAYEANLLKTKKIKKLKGQNQDLYRLKLRTYYVIYQKQNDKLFILIVSIKTRGSAYENY